MYLTVIDLCEGLTEEVQFDSANNQCLCNNGYVPALQQ